MQRKIYFHTNHYKDIKHKSPSFDITKCFAQTPGIIPLPWNHSSQKKLAAITRSEPQLDKCRTHQSPHLNTQRKQENLCTTKLYPQFLDFECFTSQSITESMLVEFLHEIMKQQTSLSVIDFSPLQRRK